MTASVGLDLGEETAQAALVAAVPARRDVELRCGSTGRHGARPGAPTVGRHAELTRHAP